MAKDKKYHAYVLNFASVGLDMERYYASRIKTHLS